MTVLAVHPQTLDVRVNKPALKLKDKGYFIFSKEEQLATWPQMKELAKLVLGKPPNKYSPNLGIVSKIWPDLHLRAVNNISAIVENQALKNSGVDLEKEPVVEMPPEPKVEAKEKLGRGNHNARIPNFVLTGLVPEIPMPPQAEILALEFNKLHAAGRRDVAIHEVKDIVLEMKLPTQQDPLRIFRYYFWLLVNAKTLSVSCEVRRDVVTRQNAFRHKLLAT